MITTFNSQNLILNPEIQHHRQTAYSTLSSQGNTYRILTKQFLSHKGTIYIWTVFWSAITLLFASLTITQIYAKGIIPVLSITVMGSFAETCLIFKMKNNFDKIVLGISLSVLLTSISILVLILCQIHLTILPCLVFSVFIVVSAAANIKKKGKIVLIILVLVQISLIAATYDGFTNISWKHALIPILPIAFLSISAFIFLSIYTTLLKFYYSYDFNSKKYTLLYLLSNILGISCIISVVVGQAYLSISPVVTATISLCFTASIAILLFLYSQELAISFCRHKQRLQQNDKQLKIQLLQKNTKQLPFLYRFAENWFGNQYQSQNKYTESLSLPQCVICIQQMSQTVWLPCGHLAICSPCCQDMLSNQMFSCVLCKQKPTKICRLQAPSKESIQLQQQMGIKNEQKNKNRYRVSQLYEIKFVQ